jgi:phosphotransferase system HPr (HPr) family protein
MSEFAQTRIVTVENRAGLHARAAMLVVNEARRFDAKVLISKGLHQVEATEMLQLMSLGAAQGEQLSIEVSGNEAEPALNALVELFVRKFDED